ncbi:MAG: autotransporter-associated beta strand repeat-containing protein, partial [Verrucomicrobiota bacterium]
MKNPKPEFRLAAPGVSGREFFERPVLTEYLLFCLAILGASGFIVPSVCSAETRTWTGAVNSFWSEPGNWTPASAPQEGDSLVFPASATRYISQNDLPSPVQLTRIELAGGGYELTGTNVTLTSDFTDSHSSGDPNEVRFFLYFSGDATVNVTGPQSGQLLDIYGQIRAGTDGNRDIKISVSTGILTLRDALVTFAFGAGGNVFKRGNGVLKFSSGNPNVYYGGMYVLEGTVFLNGNKPVYADTGTGRLTVGSKGVSQATVYVGSSPWAGQVGVEVNDSHIQFDHPTGVHFLTLREGAVVDGNGSLTVYGSIESFSDVLTPAIKLPLNIFPSLTGFNIHGANYSGIDIQTPIGGPGGILKLGDAALVLQSGNSFTGNVSVDNGILDASGANALGLGTNVTVYNEGALTLRNVAVSGKTLDVATRDQITADLVGTRLTVIGAASWSGPVVLHTNLVVLGGDMDFNGPISGPGGLFFLNGASTLGGADANTFTGPTLARGSLLRFNKPSGVRAFSSPLTVGGPFNGPCEAQWLQDYQCVGADVTLFRNSFVNLNNRREDFGPVTFNGGAVSTGASGELGLYGLLTANPSPAEAIISGRLGLPPGVHEFLVNDGSALPDLRINAHVLGSGQLRKTGTGQLWLAASNSYSGVTYVNEGTLSALNPDALGASSAGTTVNEGATLDLNAISGTLPEPLALRGTGHGGAGALNIFGIATLRNPFPSIFAAIDLTTNTTISVGAGSLLTVDGFISGIGPLTKIGTGTLLFINANANTYSGDTIIADGTLELSKPNNTISVPGDLVVGSAPFGSSGLARWSQTGGMNANAIATINAGSRLDLNGFDQTLARLNLNDGGDAQTGAGRLNIAPGGVVQVGSLSPSGSHASSSIAGNLKLPANNFITFNVAPYAIFPPFATAPELDVPALVSVNGFESPSFEPAGFSKVSLGWMRLSANNTYKGEAFISGGTLQVEGSQPQSSARVGAGGRLQGSGTIGHVYFLGSAGVIAPGASPGILTTSNFNAGATGNGNGILQVELNGTTPGSGYDQVNARGTVTLTGTTLNGSLNFPSAINDRFTIINNDGSDSVIGTFNGLPQNSSLSIGGEQFTVSYTGGTGNDVVLMRIVTPPRPVLTIEKVSPLFVRLLWPTNDPAFRLESSTNLPATNWTAALPLPVIV